MEISPISFKQNPSTLRKIVQKANIRNWDNTTKKYAGAFYPVIPGATAFASLLADSKAGICAAMALIFAYIPFLNLCMPTNKTESQPNTNIEK